MLKLIKNYLQERRAHKLAMRRAEHYEQARWHAEMAESHVLSAVKIGGALMDRELERELAEAGLPTVIDSDLGEFDALANGATTR